MTYAFQFIKKDEYLLVELSGEGNTVDDVLLLADAVLKEAKKAGTYCIMFDERNVTLNLDQHDVYCITEALADSLPGEGMRVAVIYNVEFLEIYKSFETMLQNRSINYKLFDSPKKAEAWLRSR